MSVGSPVMLGAADAPSAHVQLRVLLTYFQTGWLALLLDAVLAVVAAAWLVGVRTLHRRGRRWPAARTAAFVVGLLCLFVALSSGLSAYDDLNPSAHVFQHFLVMMVAPPLLLLARPVTLLAQATPRRLQGLVVRLVHRRGSAVLTGPLAWVLYYASMAVYWLGPLYGVSERSDAVHELCHAAFFVFGCLFWAGVASAEAPRRRSYLRRVVWVLAGMPIETAIGLGLLLRSSPLAGTSLAATHASGQVFWMTAMLDSGVAVAVLIHQWIRADERAVRRLGPPFPVGAVTVAVPGGVEAERPAEPDAPSSAPGRLVVPDR